MPIIEKLPLEILRDWHKEVEEPAYSLLAFFVMIRVRAYESEDTEAVFHDWLSERLDYFQHLGRTIQVRGLIDYHLAEMGAPEYWDHALERQLEIVEHEKTSKLAKQLVNKNLPRMPKAREVWLKTAESWDNLRSNYLTDERLWMWEREMEKEYSPL